MAFQLEGRGIVRGFLLPIMTLDASGGGRKLTPIFFQTMPSVGDQKQTTYATSDAGGRSEPFSVFQSSSPRAISLGLTYVAINQKFDIQWVNQQIARLRALLYPVYKRNNLNQSFIPPPMVLFNLGFRFVNVPCVVTSYSIDDGDEDPYEIFTMLPMFTKVTLAMQTSYPYGYAPGHDDIAIQYSGEATDYTTAKGDSVFDDMATPDYTKFTTESPVNLHQENQAAVSYQRSIELRSTQSLAYTKPLGEISFSGEGG